MQANITAMNLDRGAFHFSLPYTIWGWVAWVIGLLIAIAGFILNPMISALGFTIMAFLLQVLVPRRRVPIRPLIPGSIMIGTLLTLLNSAVSRTTIQTILSEGVKSGFLKKFVDKNDKRKKYFSCDQLKPILEKWHNEQQKIFN